MGQLAASQILSVAERKLAEIEPHVWDGESTPVPIEEIADSHFGLLVEDVTDVADAAGLGFHSGRRLSGALRTDRRAIYVDATEAKQWPRRRRYTIAHELGHWCLHRELELAARCGDSEVEPVATMEQQHGKPLERWRQPDPDGPRDLEWEANVFAGALLLPPRLIRRELRIRERHANHVEELSEIFDVSLSAVGPRWAHHYAFGG